MQAAQARVISEGGKDLGGIYIQNMEYAINGIF
jgi:hypothetical protein